MADLITGNTQLLATKQDLVAALVQKELKFATKFLPYVSDVSAYAIKGAKTISFPRLTSFTVIDRASGVQGDASQLTAAVDTLALDYNAYVAWIIDSMDSIQSNINAELEFASRAARAHARYVDEKIVSQLESEAEATATAGDLTRDIVLEMQEKLLEQNADPNMLALSISPAQRSVVLKISEFTQAQVYGNAVIPSGQIGDLYGVPVFVSNALGAQQYFMFEKSGVAIGFQAGPSMSEQMANEFGSQSKRVAMDQLFGVKLLQIGVEGAAVGKSALAIKDAN